MNDLISRQAAIDALAEEMPTPYTPDWSHPADEGIFMAQEIYADCIQTLKELPSAQPEPCEDAVSREAVSSWLKQYGQDVLHGKYKFSLMYIWKNLMSLPSVQPKRTCVNCGRTVNNGGWYADGGTRCPIEEHYALPKDGHCHLWEKRNVTDDDYPERRTDEPEK